MSIQVNLNTLTEETRTRIAKELEFTTKASFYAQSFGNDDGKTIYAFDIRNDKICIPFCFGTNHLKLERPHRNTFRKLNLHFSGKLRKLQKEVKKEALKLLNKQSCCTISLYTGGGKTATAIYLSIFINMPVLVIVTRLILMDQWANSVKKFCPLAKIQKVTTKNPPKEGMDFYLVNAINVPKFPEGSFLHIGTTIVDEMHLLGTEKLSTSFHFVHPRYLIGLSATPYRPDGLDALLNSYFGEKQIHRKLFREHIVYKVETSKYADIKLVKKTTNTGVLDWNALLNSQADSEVRNKLIISLVDNFPNKNFLILCKRVAQTKELMKMLKNQEIDATSLVGIKRHFDASARVLVATVQKAGIGFDHPKLNALIIAADIEQYFIQYLGRVFRTEVGIPVIFDLVDDFPTLKRHFASRRSVYRRHGGIIKSFNKEYPKFAIN